MNKVYIAQVWVWEKGDLQDPRPTIYTEIYVNKVGVENALRIS